MLKADGPAVNILWSMDCSEAWVTAAVRTTEKTENTMKQVSKDKMWRQEAAVKRTVLKSFRVIKGVNS